MSKNKWHAQLIQIFMDGPQDNLESIIFNYSNITHFKIIINLAQFNSQLQSTFYSIPN